VAEGVAGGGFGQCCFLERGVEGALDYGFVEVMATLFAAGGVAIVAGRGEDPLPGPALCGVGVFSAERAGERDAAGTSGEVCVVEFASVAKLLGQVAA
jgi:hypothetical protein